MKKAFFFILAGVIAVLGVLLFLQRNKIFSWLDKCCSDDEECDEECCCGVAEAPEAEVGETTETKEEKKEETAA